MANKTDLDRIEAEIAPLADQDFVVRWQGRHTITKQNLAEHHGHVVQYCLSLFNMFDVPEHDQLLAMKRAAIHDLPETEIADVPYPTHKKFPELSEAYDKVEESVWTNKYKAFRNDVDKGSRIWILVKVADRLDRVAFIKKEQEFGNNCEYFDNALKDEQKEISSLLARLENEYGKKKE